jgi:hypothetical protein
MVNLGWLRGSRHSLETVKVLEQPLDPGSTIPHDDSLHRRRLGPRSGHAAGGSRGRRRGPVAVALTSSGSRACRAPAVGRAVPLPHRPETRGPVRSRRSAPAPSRTAVLVSHNQTRKTIAPASDPYVASKLEKLATKRPNRAEAASHTTVASTAPELSQRNRAAGRSG